MVALHFETETEAPEEVDCSWDSIIQGIEQYAAFRPAATRDLQHWADLLEGIRQLREEA